ncbi:hypothetical protein HPB47_002456 [Ixodes persulcatus]|uniref:Uncharacterized protein n=1 Tax=Ixodes persulcatus TaxID=34615 RepID=A0AC60PLB0_IXOPE|nr:hypothetical protein HPB47_002456 [Ixodes persulcatus]
MSQRGARESDWERRFRACVLGARPIPPAGVCVRGGLAPIEPGVRVPAGGLIWGLTPVLRPRAPAAAVGAAVPGLGPGQRARGLQGLSLSPHRRDSASPLPLQHQTFVLVAGKVRVTNCPPPTTQDDSAQSRSGSAENARETRRTRRRLGLAAENGTSSAEGEGARSGTVPEAGSPKRGILGCYGGKIFPYRALPPPSSLRPPSAVLDIRSEFPLLLSRLARLQFAGRSSRPSA